ncbi:MAG: hypothetical protein MJ192_08220 [Clostridia bacterium]|nr:hypothetical protein [Clostridia bacterium]
MPDKEPIRDVMPDVRRELDDELRAPSAKGRSRRSKSTYRVAACGVFCALGTVLLCLGALIEVMDLACAVLAAILFLPIFYRYGGGYTLACWGVTSVLGLILVPHSLSPWLFLCLLGYYPVLKRQVDRLPKPAALVIKIVIACAAMAVYMLAFWVIMLQGSAGFKDTFLAAFGDPVSGFGFGFAWIFIALCFITFFAFDLLIDRVKLIYCLKWRARAEKWLK